MEITKDILDLCSRPVGDVVAEDYRRARVFAQYGIDFCCGGDKTVRAASEAKGIDCNTILQSLAAAEAAPVEARQPAHLDVRGWEPDFLASYIVNVHHRYVREQAPRLRELTQTIARVHGETNPETIRIAALTDELTCELEAHALEEERGLFPYVTALCAARRGAAPPAHAAEGEIADPIATLEHEHDQAGALMREIRTLSGGFRVPENACNTFRIAYAELEAFEADLHRHVHLENNILFPAAAQMAQALAQPA